MFSQITSLLLQADHVEISKLGEDVKDVADKLKPIIEKCDSTEELALSLKVTALTMIYEQIVEILSKRTELYQEVLEFQEVESSSHALYDGLERDSKEMKTDTEIAAAMDKMANQRPQLEKWGSRTAEIDNLAKKAKVTLKSKDTHKQYSPDDELRNLIAKDDTLCAKLKSKQETVAEATRIGDQLEEKVAKLMEWLDETQKELEKEIPPVANVDDVKTQLPIYEVCHN